MELSSSSNGFLKPLLDPGNRFTSETAAVTSPFQKRSGHKYITVICNGHSATDKSTRSGVTVTVIKRPWPLAKGKGFILVSGVRIFTGYYLSFF
jgi:hypothetical protein